MELLSLQPRGSVLQRHLRSRTFLGFGYDLKAEQLSGLIVDTREGMDEPDQLTGSHLDKQWGHPTGQGLPR